jgi:hypothetical protein
MDEIFERSARGCEGDHAGSRKNKNSQLSKQSIGIHESAASVQPECRSTTAFSPQHRAIRTRTLSTVRF